MEEYLKRNGDAMSSSEKVRSSPIINEIKDLATKLNDSATPGGRMPRHRALNVAAQQMGFADYNAAVSQVKYGSVVAEKPLVFCCRCSHKFEDHETPHKSTLTAVHENLFLCIGCVRKEQKDLRRSWKTRDEKIAELLKWYRTPKMKQVKLMTMALALQKRISHAQAREIVALVLGFQDFDTLVLEYEKTVPPSTPGRIKRSIKRHARVGEKTITVKRREIRNLQSKLREARVRNGDRVFEKSSGTMHTRVGLLGSHNVPIDKVATRVVFTPKRMG
jgi:hypothetical protein